LKKKKKAPPIIIGHINGAIKETAKAPVTLYELITGTARINSIGIIQHKDNGKKYFKVLLVSLFIYFTSINL